jgi:hypothetical protein
MEWHGKYCVQLIRLCSLSYSQYVIQQHREPLSIFKRVTGYINESSKLVSGKVLQLQRIGCTVRSC